MENPRLLIPVNISSRENDDAREIENVTATQTRQEECIQEELASRTPSRLLTAFTLLISLDLLYSFICQLEVIRDYTGKINHYCDCRSAYK